MTARTDTSLASLLLVNRLVNTGVEPLQPREYWQLVGRLKDPALLLKMRPEEISTAIPDLDADRLRRLLDSSTQLAFELERLEQSGIKVLSPFDEDYPKALSERLASSAPPILHAVGSLAILSTSALGVVGSRQLSAAAKKAAREAAKKAVELGLAVVSGGAKGADVAAMDAAFESGGVVVGVLADSLERRVRQPDIRRAIADERLCLISPFKPDAGFSIGSAMSRNKIIYALCRLTFVVTSDTKKGGTWQGAEEALRKRFGRVGAWIGSGSGPGNPELVKRGAAPVESMDELSLLLDESIGGPTGTRDENAEQLSLGL